jgi:hypothetical protein
MTRATVLVLAIVLGAAVPAAAQPSADDRAEAKKAFKRAEAAEKRKDWRTAIDEYQRAYELAPHPYVLYNIALDYERLEEFRDAATFYRRYLDEQPDASDRARVEKLITTLRARPGTVTVTSDTPGAAVLVDGRRAGSPPAEVDLAGAHRIEIESDGQKVGRDIVVEFGEPQKVHLTLVAKTGALVVTSNVAGADIYVDGELAGHTPTTLVVPAGTHRLVVAADGWASHERPVDVPAEGMAQVTANLVRPLGYVDPDPPPVATRYYTLLGGGADAGGAGVVVSVMFGAHRGRFGFGIGYAFGGGGTASAIAGYGGEIKAYLTRGSVRPYVKATGMLGTLSWLAGHAGVLVGRRVGAGARAETALYLDLGIGWGRIAADGAAEPEKVMVIPIIGGLQISY